MQIKRTVIGLAVTAAAAAGLAAGAAATSPDIYYDLSPATNHSPATGVPDQGTATADASSTGTPDIYYDL